MDECKIKQIEEGMKKTEGKYTVIENRRKLHD